MSAPSLDDRKAYVLDRVDMRTLATNSGATLKGRSPRGKCPFCGGGGFAIVKAKGGSLLNRWRCYSACDAGGNAIDFLMKRDSVPFFDALRSLERDVGGLADFTPEKREQLHRKRLSAERIAAERAERKRQAALQRIEATLAELQPLAAGTLAWRYLEDRGLDMASLAPRLVDGALGFHTAVGHWDDWDPQAGAFKRTYPALVARLTKLGDAGAPETVAMQAIYLEPLRQAAPPAVRSLIETREGKARGRYWRPQRYRDTPKIATGGWSGAMCRLTALPDDGVLGLAEGVEKALAVMQLYGGTCWPVMFAGNFETAVIEPEIAALEIWLDNNAKLVDRKTGEITAPGGVSEMYARRRQAAWATTARGPVELKRPPVGEDFSDFLLLWRAGMIDDEGRPRLPRAELEAMLKVPEHETTRMTA